MVIIKGKVSIITPCYNDGKYIEETIHSILSQTYKNWEMIIIDDGSEDNETIDILKKVELIYNIQVIKTNHVGPAEARNIGIKHSCGEFILPVDADDLIDNTYIEKAVQQMNNNNNIGIVYCHADLFGIKTGPWELPEYSIDKMLLDNIIFVSALFRKSDWEQVGGFKSNMEHGMEDYDFWLSIIELGREVYQLPEVLFHYRVKEYSRTTKFHKNIENVKETYKTIYIQHKVLYEKYRDKYAIVLRDTLIEYIFMNRAYSESIAVIEKLKRIPFLEYIIKRFIIK